MSWAVKSSPYLYLNHEVIRKKGLDQAAVEKAVAAEMLKFKGVAYACWVSKMHDRRHFHSYVVFN